MLHIRTISYRVKDGSGKVRSQGRIPATRCDLDRWMKMRPQPWSATIESIFPGNTNASYLWDRTPAATLPIYEPVVWGDTAGRKISDHLRRRFNGA